MRDPARLKRGSTGNFFSRVVGVCAWRAFSLRSSHNPGRCPWFHMVCRVLVSWEEGEGKGGAGDGGRCYAAVVSAAARCDGGMKLQGTEGGAQ